MFNVVKLGCVSLEGKDVKEGADLGFEKSRIFKCHEQLTPFYKKKNPPVVYLFSHQYYLAFTVGFAEGRNS